jgi:hypothetical protein
MTPFRNPSQEELAKLLKLKVTPSKLDEIIRRAKPGHLVTADVGQLASDALAHGRQALLAAAEAGKQALFIHVFDVGKPYVGMAKREALKDAKRAAEAMLTFYPFPSELRRTAEAFIEELRRHVRHDEQPALPSGSPGRAVPRAMTEAAAQRWAILSESTIPRAGVKQRTDGTEHPLKLLLDAISQDIYGSVGHLSPNQLRK